MSTIQEDLESLLTPLAPTYPMVAIQNQGVTSYIIYQRIDKAIENVMAGNGSQPINNSRIQVDAFAKTYSGAQTLANAIKSAMQGWIKQNVQLTEQDIYEEPVKLYRISMDFSIWSFN